MGTSAAVLVIGVDSGCCCARFSAACLPEALLLLLIGDYGILGVVSEELSLLQKFSISPASGPG